MVVVIISFSVVTSGVVEKFAVVGKGDCVVSCVDLLVVASIFVVVSDCDVVCSRSDVVPMVVNADVVVGDVVVGDVVVGDVVGLSGSENIDPLTF